MKKYTLVLASLFLLIILGNIDAASFDCRKATSEVEKMICEDQTLSNTDEELAALYASISPLFVASQRFRQACSQSP